MKKHCFYLFCILFIINDYAIAQNQQGNQETGNLTVVINGLENETGDVRMGLFNSEESFKGQGKKFRGAIIKPEKKKAIWEIIDLPYGIYAIKVFHDEDQDDEIDKKFGIPSEGFGFSNSPNIFLGPPNFEKTKFRFNTDSMKIEIKLINF